MHVFMYVHTMFLYWKELKIQLDSVHGHVFAIPLTYSNR